MSGRFTLLTRFKVCVSQGSTLDPNTTLTEDALGANAAAEAGRSWTGIGDLRRLSKKAFFDNKS